ncbi:hypothetical protein ACWXWI_22520, partial [Pantoea ananatis]
MHPDPLERHRAWLGSVFRNLTNGFDSFPHDQFLTVLRTLLVEIAKKNQGAQMGALLVFNFKINNKNKCLNYYLSPAFAP